MLTHSSSSGRHAKAVSDWPSRRKSVLGIVRRLSTEHPDRDLLPLRRRIIDNRARAGYDVAAERQMERQLRREIAVLRDGPDALMPIAA